MNDEELDRLVAQSMYSNTDVRSLDLRVGEADLMENVMNSENLTIEGPQPVRPKPRAIEANCSPASSSEPLSPLGAGPPMRSLLTGSAQTRPNSSKMSVLPVRRRAASAPRPPASSRVPPTMGAPSSTGQLTVPIPTLTSCSRTGAHSAVAGADR